MKVAFYIPNKSIKDVNLEHIDLGNPGIGGTEYAMLALAFYLGKMSKYDITLYVSNKLNNYPLNCNVHFVNNLKEVLSQSLANQIRILVVHHSEETMGKNAFQALGKSNISIVVWIHNFLKTKYLTYYNSIDAIKRIVFVGKQKPPSGWMVVIQYLAAGGQALSELCSSFALRSAEVLSYPSRHRTNHRFHHNYDQ